jgi:hypothetical protein
MSILVGLFTLLFVGESDDVLHLQIPHKDQLGQSAMEMKKGSMCIAIGAKFVVTIIKDAVADNPGITLIFTKLNTHV